MRTRVRPFLLPACIEFTEKVSIRTGYQRLAWKCKKNVIAIERPSPACALQQEWIARRIFAVELSQVRWARDLADELSQLLEGSSFRLCRQTRRSWIEPSATWRHAQHSACNPGRTPDPGYPG